MSVPVRALVVDDSMVVADVVTALLRRTGWTVDVATSVERYTQFTIFDDVSAKVNDGVVTLTGKVTMPYKRDDIAKRVAKVAGVEIHNFYIPAGGDTPDRQANAKFDHKLDFYEKLTAELARRSPSEFGEPLATVRPTSRFLARWFRSPCRKSRWAGSGHPAMQRMRR